MRLIDADALIDTLVNISNNDQFRFFPIWIEKQIGAQPTVTMLKEQDKEDEKHQAILEQYDMALELLKCLEPVRPIRKKEIGAYHSLYCVCGNCGAWLLDGQKFCDECGRKVKWDARQGESNKRMGSSSQP